MVIGAILMAIPVKKYAFFAFVLGAVLPASLPSSFANQATDANAVQALSDMLGRTEWRQGFDQASRAVPAPVKSSSPILGAATVEALELAVQRYTTYALEGGWKPIPNNGTLRLGVSHPNVALLRERLIKTGDMPADAPITNVFDSFVEAGVKRFQSRNGIITDGVAGKFTLAAMNVPAEVRVAQLRLNQERIREASAKLPNRYVMVNIPGAEIEAVRGGLVETRFNAIVGKIDRQTPLLESKIHELNFNPYWTVPKSIIRKDLIPIMQKEPDYLTRYKIRIFDNKGSEIAPQTVDWKTDEAVNYTLRQDPGSINSMGSVKINFYNKHAVYLHDTPKKSLFGTNQRFHSSGCVRVQNVREMLVWLLSEEPDWSRGRVDSVFRTGERLDVRLKNPVPLLTVYFTAWVSEGGAVHFREDVYNRDGLGTSL